MRLKGSAKSRPERSASTLHAAQQVFGSALKAVRIRVQGRVQGVGYRPFIHHLAHEHGIAGWVCNDGAEVEIHAEGPGLAVDGFIESVQTEAPPLAEVEHVTHHSVPAAGCTAFRIHASHRGGSAQVRIPPDQPVCEHCLAELHDPADRRYRYPFINCTRCGPRYSLIDTLPYDRANTGMRDFDLCPACAAQYHDPRDRRFHAQPLACPECGPGLLFVRQNEVVSGNEAALAACIRALRQGKIIAIKGIGGYHLACDARNAEAIRLLRQRKPRAHKPLAVMFAAPGKQLSVEVRISDRDRQCLESSARPILLLPWQASATLPREALAPGLDALGVMLPYSPLHHLLLGDFGAPLVMTSANPAGEPVLTENDAAERRLALIADGFLHHNRPILRPADDPISRPMAGGYQPLRLGRGNAPLELKLPFRLQKAMLASGAQMKNTVALAWDDRAVISPHVGELDTPRAQDLFARLADELPQLYEIEPDILLADRHPDFAGHRWARDRAATRGLAFVTVQHHHAHASALYAEHACRGDMLVFTWDGVGLGEDGSLWGGEAFLGRPGRWQRRATLKPFRPPGSERAAREPWRSALGLAWEAGMERHMAQESRLLKQAWQRGLNSPQASAAGRFLDGCANLLGLLDEASFEGQAPMWLEAVADMGATPVELPLSEQEGLMQIDWRPLLPLLLNPDRPQSQRAGQVLASLGEAIITLALQSRQQQGIETLGLSGGVFQNRKLVDYVAQRCMQEGLHLLLAERVPANDAGLSYGQIIEAAHAGGWIEEQ